MSSAIPNYPSSTMTEYGQWLSPPKQFHPITIDEFLVQYPQYNNNRLINLCGVNNFPQREVEIEVLLKKQLPKCHFNFTSEFKDSKIILNYKESNDQFIKIEFNLFKSGSFYYLKNSDLLALQEMFDKAKPLQLSEDEKQYFNEGYIRFDAFMKSIKYQPQISLFAPPPRPSGQRDSGVFFDLRNLQNNNSSNPNSLQTSTQGLTKQSLANLNVSKNPRNSGVFAATHIPNSLNPSSPIPLPQPTLQSTTSNKPRNSLQVEIPLSTSQRNLTQQNVPPNSLNEQIRNLIYFVSCEREEAEKKLSEEKIDGNFLIREASDKKNFVVSYFCAQDKTMKHMRFSVEKGLITCNGRTYTKLKEADDLFTPTYISYTKVGDCWKPTFHREFTSENGFLDAFVAMKHIGHPFNTPLGNEYNDFEFNPPAPKDHEYSNYPAQENISPPKQPQTFDFNEEYSAFPGLPKAAPHHVPFTPPVTVMQPQPPISTIATPQKSIPPEEFKILNFIDLNLKFTDSSIYPINSTTPTLKDKMLKFINEGGLPAAHYLLIEHDQHQNLIEFHYKEMDGTVRKIDLHLYKKGEFYLKFQDKNRMMEHISQTKLETEMIKRNLFEDMDQLSGYIEFDLFIHSIKYRPLTNMDMTKAPQLSRSTSSTAVRPTASYPPTTTTTTTSKDSKYGTVGRKSPITWDQEKLPTTEKTNVSEQRPFSNKNSYEYVNIDQAELARLLAQSTTETTPTQPQITAKTLMPPPQYNKHK